MKKIWKRIVEFVRSLFKGGKGGGFDYGTLDWCYGGVNGSGAVEDLSQNGYTVHSASADVKGIRFKGSGGMWGNTYDKAKARNCIFFEENGVFHGGFWEWGSLKREYRGFDNIYSGYKGWNAQRMLKSKRWLFFVMTEKGDKRSNAVFIDR